jgi:transglutaminase-like putative cysteine protease
MPVNAYLASTEHIDWRTPAVLAKARALADGSADPHDVARRCFEFVRDEIKHSWDHRVGPVTCSASATLAHRTGYCYAKSHLLAALLRANGVPAGLCYQRLSVGDSGAPYCLHGLNAIGLPGLGWYRVDARGNKPGIDARFCPPRERLAFDAKGRLEADLPEIWPEPLSVVVRALTTWTTIEEVAANLPDVELLSSRRTGVGGG